MRKYDAMMLFRFLFLVPVIGLLITLISTNCLAQSHKQAWKSAAENYDQGDYEAAIAGFNYALEKKKSAAIAYNLGNAYVKEQEYGAAKEAYREALQLEADPSLQADIFFNLGNTLIAENELEQAIEAFKNALKRKPRDPEIIHNLLKAKELLKQMEQQSAQQDPQEGNDEQQNESGEESSQNQEEQEQNSESNEEDTSPQNEGSKEEQNTQQSEPEEGNDQEAIEQLLRIMEEEERRVQQKMQRQQQRPNRSTKRW